MQDKFVDKFKKLLIYEVKPLKVSKLLLTVNLLYVHKLDL